MNGTEAVKSWSNCDNQGEALKQLTDTSVLSNTQCPYSRVMKPRSMRVSYSQESRSIPEPVQEP